MGNALKNSISEPLDFNIFLGAGGNAPRSPQAARAFGARNLPRLVLKSGYGPEFVSFCRDNKQMRVTSKLV